MMNYLGKGLVLVNLAASLILMSWSMAVYFQKIDWGWSEPRKVLEGRVPAEIDKRVAAVHEYLKTVGLLVTDLHAAQASLAQIEPSFAVNHVYYLKELDTLRNSPNPVVVKDLLFKNGALVLDPNTPVGVPKMGPVIPELTKSEHQYQLVLKNLERKISEVNRELDAVLEKQKELTVKLNGKDDTGKVVKVGLYGLLEREHQAQEKLREEREYVQPLWTEAMEELEVYQERHEALKRNLERLKKSRRASNKID
jgi:hypothetical protein